MRHGEIDQLAADLVGLVVCQTLEPQVVPAAKPGREPGPVARVRPRSGSDALHQPMLTVFITAPEETSGVDSALIVDHGPGGRCIDAHIHGQHTRWCPDRCDRCELFRQGQTPPSSVESQQRGFGGTATAITKLSGQPEIHPDPVIAVPDFDERLRGGLVELDALAAVQARKGAGTGRQPWRPRVRVPTLTIEPVAVPAHKRSDLANGIHDGHSAQVGREFVVPVLKVAIPNTRTLGGGMDQAFDHSHRLVTLGGAHRRPVRERHRHQVSHQSTIQRQRLGQRVALGLAVSVNSESIGTNNSHAGNCINKQP